MKNYLVCNLIKNLQIKLNGKSLSIILLVETKEKAFSMIKILNSTLEFNNEIIIVYDHEMITQFLLQKTSKSI